MVETFTQLQRSGKTVYAVTESLDKEYCDRRLTSRATTIRMFGWMLLPGSQCVDHVAKSLAKFDPPHARNTSPMRRRIEKS